MIIRGKLGIFFSCFVVCSVAASPVMGAYGSVMNTVHNLSASGPGEVKSSEETRICRFCHIPHNAELPEALWSRALSKAQYIMPEISAEGGGRIPTPQPNVSSRLCLSCHDGTIALGDIAGQPGQIPMRGGQRLQEGRPGFLGTDLSGSHPISFKLPEAQPGGRSPENDIGIKTLGVIRASDTVSLDDMDRMQCTTCHDPHDDSNYEAGKVPRFWVASTVDEVCLACHVLR